ncbi:MAG: (2Fe-2S) ferredoxin domain-containing protein [Bdellovibrionota bacterium]
MQTRDKPILAQLFVCTHHRDVGESCDAAGALDIFKNLKNRSKTDPAWQNRISVTKSGCLGFCHEGVAAVLYPQRQWLTGIKADDEESIFKWVNETADLVPVTP